MFFLTQQGDQEAPCRKAAPCPSPRLHVWRLRGPPHPAEERAGAPGVLTGHNSLVLSREWGNGSL